MKDWPADHPKARLMASKQAAILEAARDAFLCHGYDGVSMETIADLAGVSVMTLYRHAQGKDNLFAAVVAAVCHPADPVEQARIEESLLKPLGEILEFVAVMFQERIKNPTTTSLFRVVMVETSRHPHLAQMAFEGLIGAHQDALDAFLADRAETASIEVERRRELVLAFLDRLVGLDSYRVLLGLSGISETERLQRARSATAELLLELDQQACTRRD